MSVQDCDARDVNRLAPDYLAHWVVKTARSLDAPARRQNAACADLEDALRWNT